MGWCVSGLEAHGLAVLRLGAREVMRLAEEIPQCKMCLEKTWRDAHRPAVFRDGRLKIPLCAQGPGQSEVQAGALRVALKRGVKLGNRLIEMARNLELDCMLFKRPRKRQPGRIGSLLPGAQSDSQGRTDH